MSKQLLPDFPPSPLDSYRNLASFDWRKLKLFIEPAEIVEYKNEIVELLKGNPAFHPKKLETLDDVRRDASIKMHEGFYLQEFKYLGMLDNVRKMHAFNEIIVLWDTSFSVKNSINNAMYPIVIRALGTKKHIGMIVKVLQGEHFGCFCLTEIGHGSDTKRMRTRATYDKESKGFIMHTPDFEAAKCWAGLLGQTATHAIVYAQLYTPDGTCHGLHQFVVQIRDIETLQPLPGITVGDMGPKIGLNGIDNGFLLFNNVHVSKDALLNKNVDVTEEGVYVISLKDPSKRFGASLAAISEGRLNITNLCSAYLIQGITIAVRYAAVRKQFGPNDDEEISIFEYQTHQHRLLPYLAGAFTFKFFSSHICLEQYTNYVNTMNGEQRKDAVDYGFEMHGISSACKPVISWFLMEALNEFRQACAGHGYLKAAGIGELRNDADANCTYEGENHVLNQQTSNWLLKFWPQILEGKIIKGPMESIDYLSRGKEILADKFAVDSVEHIVRPEYILRMYKWLVVYLLKSSYEKYERSLKESNDAFWAKNNNQVYYARSLSVAYINHYMLHVFLKRINEAEDPKVRNVLERLFALYGLFTLERSLGHLYKGGFFVGEKPATLIQDAVLKLCEDLKNDAVSLIDCIAPDDFLINSFMGKSDGKVYEHLQNELMGGEGNMSKPNWWKEVLHSKL
ncbi:PREDICTED: peroxisomal acyl-coenzyme A oxidase 3-like [Nicrophorus vespilloides]|uniref:Acyl-coenzyme A oxidase n=1 Tax=Nicrophorus vespilloides TaxID=110193 RepID=A0ABM1M8X8_NICVS|nr:PREDICTED: peroxisomal acyl-coenzyme A oxidase 3-like [Nicrophorus vespilloides]